MALDIKDRVPTRPGRIKLTAEDGTSQYYTMERADEPSQEGTAINKALLDDMCKAENTLVSSDVQTIFGKNNVDECLSSMDNILKLYRKATFLRNVSVNLTTSGTGAVLTASFATLNELKEYDEFYLIGNVNIALSTTNNAIATLSLLCAGGSNVSNIAAYGVNGSGSCNFAINGKAPIFTIFRSVYEYNSTDRFYATTINSGSLRSGSTQDNDALTIQLKGNNAYITNATATGTFKLYGVKAVLE